MPYEPVLGIDIGASYSKVAIRDREAHANGEIFCTHFLGQIPSLVICDSSRGKDVWLFGDDAAHSDPGDKRKFHENWKSALFAKEAGANYTQAVIVAHEFFKWLREWVEKKGIDPAAQRVRVCVPEFGDIEPYASTLAQIMDDSGWREVQILKVSEPRANAVGIMSGGRNCLLPGDYLGLGPMFEKGGLYVRLADAYRNGHRGPSVRLCLLDVGSFTTDVAGITINLGAERYEGIETSIQKSWRHGIINELDHVVMPRIFAAHGLKWMGVKFSEREEVKERLYAGERYASERYQMGDAADANVVTDALNQFSDDLWQNIHTDVTAFAPDFCFLTGGGCRINKIAAELEQRFRELGCHVVPVPDADENATTERAERVATALGAASVILDAEETGSVVPRVPPTFQRTEAGWVTCRCNGMNIHCCFCSGEGAYERD